MKPCTLSTHPLVRLRMRHMGMLVVLLSTVVVLLFGSIPAARAATGDFTVSAPGGLTVPSIWCAAGCRPATPATIAPED